MSEEGFSGPQVCKIVGITYRQLDYWARSELIRPSLADAKGSGSKRRYSFHDLVVIKLIKRILDAGNSLQAARRAIDTLQAAGDDVVSAKLVLSENGSVLAESDEAVIDLLRGGQGMLFIVPMEGVLNEVRAGIAELSAQQGPSEAQQNPGGQSHAI